MYHEQGCVQFVGRKDTACCSSIIYFLAMEAVTPTSFEQIDLLPSFST